MPSRACHTPRPSLVSTSNNWQKSMPSMKSCSSSAMALNIILSAFPSTSMHIGMHTSAQVTSPVAVRTRVFVSSIRSLNLSANSSPASDSVAPGSSNALYICPAIEIWIKFRLSDCRDANMISSISVLISSHILCLRSFSFSSAESICRSNSVHRISFPFVRRGGLPMNVGSPGNKAGLLRRPLPILTVQPLFILRHCGQQPFKRLVTFVRTLVCRCSLVRVEQSVYSLLSSFSLIVSSRSSFSFVKLVGGAISWSGPIEYWICLI